MKKLIFTLVALVLIVWGFWAAMHKNPAPTPSSSSNLLTYADPNGEFSFQYPPTFAVTGAAEDYVAKVSAPQSLAPNTNFVEAWVEVKATSTPTCQGTETSRGAAAGSRYDTTIILKKGPSSCYSLESTIHYGNIQNYDPSLGITEFDESAVSRALDPVISTFTPLK